LSVTQNVKKLIERKDVKRVTSRITNHERASSTYRGQCAYIKTKGRPTTEFKKAVYDVLEYMHNTGK